jgi:hypothetical protein
MRSLLRCWLFELADKAVQRPEVFFTLLLHRQGYKLMPGKTGQGIELSSVPSRSSKLTSPKAWAGSGPENVDGFEI